MNTAASARDLHHFQHPHIGPAMVLLVGLVYCSRDPQISLFSNFFIKNESHDTIHTFKNYFVTVFSVSASISSIQTDLISLIVV